MRLTHILYSMHDRWSSDLFFTLYNKVVFEVAGILLFPIRTWFEFLLFRKECPCHVFPWEVNFKPLDKRCLTSAEHAYELLTDVFAFVFRFHLCGTISWRSRGISKCFDYFVDENLYILYYYRSFSCFSEKLFSMVLSYNMMSFSSMRSDDNRRAAGAVDLSASRFHYEQAKSSADCRSGGKVLVSIRFHSLFNHRFGCGLTSPSIIGLLLYLFDWGFFIFILMASWEFLSIAPMACRKKLTNGEK